MPGCHGDSLVGPIKHGQSRRDALPILHLDRHFVFGEAAKPRPKAGRQERADAESDESAFSSPPRRPFGYTIPMFSFFCPPFRQFHFDEIAILVGVLEEGPFAALLWVRRTRNPRDLPAKQPRHHRHDVELRLPRRFAFQRPEGIRGHRLRPHLLPSREVGCKRRAPQTEFHRLMNFELFFCGSRSGLESFLFPSLRKADKFDICQI